MPQHEPIDSQRAHKNGNNQERDVADLLHIGRRVRPVARRGRLTVPSRRLRILLWRRISGPWRQSLGDVLGTRGASIRPRKPASVTSQSCRRSRFDRGRTSRTSIRGQTLPTRSSPAITAGNRFLGPPPHVLEVSKAGDRASYAVSPRGDTGTKRRTRCGFVVTRGTGPVEPNGDEGNVNENVAPMPSTPVAKTRPP